MHERSHLRRLPRLWFPRPVYFITICTAKRRTVLVAASAALMLMQSLHEAARVHGWAVGRFVVMPDHVHFFCRATAETKTLSIFVRDWKRWTARQIGALGGDSGPLWQKEFFDHVLRSRRSYEEKWRYVRENPVRAGLVGNADDWPFQGECEALPFPRS